MNARAKNTESLENKPVASHQIDDRLRITIRVEDQFLHSLAVQEFEREISIANHGSKGHSFFYQVYVDDFNSRFNIASLNNARLFIRGTQLMYHRVMLEINPCGKIIHVTNLPEIVKQWDTIKEHLLLDHTGGEVDAYLQKKGSRLEDMNSTLADIRSLSVFGLLFMEVPGKRSLFNAASRNREIRLNREVLMVKEEWTGCDSLPDDSDERLFRFSGELTTDSCNEGIELCGYAGNLRFNYNSHHVVEAGIELKLENKKRNYKLKRI